MADVFGLSDPNLNSLVRSSAPGALFINVYDDFYISESTISTSHLNSKDISGSFQEFQEKLGCLFPGYRLPTYKETALSITHGLLKQKKSWELVNFHEDMNLIPAERAMNLIPSAEVEMAVSFSRSSRDYSILSKIHYLSLKRKFPEREFWNVPFVMSLNNLGVVVPLLPSVSTSGSTIGFRLAYNEKGKK
jgi:hypothetical protein